MRSANSAAGIDFVALGARGGKVTAAESKAKAAALRELHARRRGKRINSADRPRVVAQTLALVHMVLREPAPGIKSIRALAGRLHISDRTVRRWLAGVDWPSATHLRAMRAWLRELERKDLL